MGWSTLDYLLACGVLGPLWMLCGVYAGGRLYPGYSHTKQAMSELGARERPTTRIHPYINNYPIGILFTAFGIGVLAVAHGTTLSLVASLLLVLHGLAHIVCGLFPLDADLGVGGNLSAGHKIHGVSGLVMYFALWFACAAWIFIEIPSVPGFRVYSLFSAAASFVSLGFMVRSLKTGRDVGLHQRVSYGVLAAWCIVLGILLLRETTRAYSF